MPHNAQCSNICRCGWWFFFSNWYTIQFIVWFFEISNKKKLNRDFSFYSLVNKPDRYALSLCVIRSAISMHCERKLYFNSLCDSIIPFIQIFTIIRIVREVNRKAVYIHPKSNTISRWPKKFAEWNGKQIALTCFAWSQRVCVCVSFWCAH